MVCCPMLVHLGTLAVLTKQMPDPSALLHYMACHRMRQTKAFAD